MENKLDILKNSLRKKESMLDELLSSHFSDVKLANGQPLNDKRNGRATLNRWERQNDRIGTQNQEIEKTKRAIEREGAKILLVSSVDIPIFIKNLIDKGVITQWRRHPNRFFVVGGGGARLILDAKTDIVKYNYLDKSTGDEYKLFANVYNTINREYNKKIKPQT